MGECLIIRGGGGTDTSNATATASVVLSGYTCYVDDQLIAGSMPVQTLNQKLEAGGSVTIPAGYYDGNSSIISTSTLAEETAANAASSHILSGYSGWVNGVLVNGSMVNRGNVSRSLGANGSYTIPAGWHAGSGKVSQSLTTQGGKTVTPKTTNQTAVAANRWTTGNIIVAGASTLTAGNIRNGITIFGIRGTCVGWVDNSRTYVNTALNRLYVYGTSAQYLWDNTISGTTLTNIKNSFKTAYVWARVYVHGQNYTTTGAAYVYENGRGYELASNSTTPNEGASDFGSRTVTLASLTSLRTAVYGRCNMNAGHGWVEGNIQIRFDK